MGLQILQSIEEFLQERKAALSFFVKKWSSDVAGDEAIDELIKRYSSVASQLDDLSDVVITNPTANKQTLIHDGTTFVNRQLAVADLSDSNTLATNITTTNIQNELGGTIPISLSEC